MILVTHSWKSTHVHCVSLTEYCMSLYTVPNKGQGYITVTGMYSMSLCENGKTATQWLAGT